MANLFKESTNAFRLCVTDLTEQLKAIYVHEIINRHHNKKTC